MTTKQQPPTKTWTPRMVRDAIRDGLTVEIEIHGTIYTGHVKGRLNDFATILVEETGARCEVAWQTLANCLTTGHPVQY